MKKNDPIRESGAARGHEESKTYRRNSSTSRPAKQAPAGSKALPRRLKQTLKLLEKRGRRGVTKLDAPKYLALALSGHVHQLRRRGFDIVTLREPLGDSWLGRYVLLGGS